jgi:hypothetical protein
MAKAREKLKVAAIAIGANAAGAVAVGALAIGRIAIRRLAVLESRIHSLEKGARSNNYLSQDGKSIGKVRYGMSNGRRLLTRAVLCQCSNGACSDLVQEPREAKVERVIARAQVFSV